MPKSASPFLEISEADWLCANGLCFAIFDSFPVTPGHVLVITRRVVPTFFECTPAEQAALMELVTSVKTLLDARLDPQPDGYNVGFNSGAAAGQTVPHVHVHVIPRYAGDMADPRGGVRHVIPGKGNYLAPAEASAALALSLSTGHPQTSLWKNLVGRLPGATEIDLLVSFVQPSGLDIIQQAIFAAIAAGARVRLVVGDYLCITSPAALRRLLGWSDLAGEALQARLAELKNLRGSPASFHPKAWRIADASGGVVVVGSSNLSRAALETGVEWNLIGKTSGEDSLDREIAAAVEDLWQQSTPLSVDVVERYATRAAQAAKLRHLWDETGAVQRLPVAENESAAGMSFEADDGRQDLPSPRPWQREALASLAAIRAEGYSKALVAVATGLGKTWLAAFDVVAHSEKLGRPPRVLVIAHRAEILAQAESTLRLALEPASVSWCAGASSDLSGQLVIASIQKLARPEGLEALAAAPPFDYCVIDEVHHAEAPSYRRVLARLKSVFTLGLTATPERTDGVDVATLFDDILAYQATVGDGIAEGSLVPFRYRGLKDDVDFEQIPWRNGRFDPLALEVALENSDRMDRLWAEWEIGDGSGFPPSESDANPVTMGNPLPSPISRRTLVFCCSRRHALFARDWLVKRGVRAAAVFSGEGSDPRMASLAAFQEGRLEALCAVDLFNEGIDLPLVDRVVMLRPTESKIVFLQQLGRGLRAATGKTRLDVIDFVGNHRVFASRLVHLLSLAPSAETSANATLFAVLKGYLSGSEPLLPAGCVLDVEVEAKQLLEQFLPKGKTAVVEAYRDLRADLARRPAMTEIFHRGYNPRTLPPDFTTWFDFVAAEGDATDLEAECLSLFRGWFVMLATTRMTKSFKMVLLRVLLDNDAVFSGMPIPELAAKCREFLVAHEFLRRDIADAATGQPVKISPQQWVSSWRKFPISIWMQEQEGRSWFTIDDDSLRVAFECEERLRGSLESMSGELVDFRLAAHARPRASATGFLARVIQSRGKPFLKLPTVDEEPGRPNGPVLVGLPDAREWEFRFVKIACNVAGPREGRVGDTLHNELPSLLRKWFGPDAGLPGTSFEVEFRREGDAWFIAPVRGGVVSNLPNPIPTPTVSAPPGPLLDSPPPASRYTTHVPVYDLTAAAGFWGPESVPEEIGWTEVPGVTLKPGMFVARVTGRSMEPLIADGSWCLFRPCPAGSREGRIVLVQLSTVGAGENGGRFTVKKYHSEKTVTADGWRHDRIQLLPVNQEFAPIEIEPEDAGDLMIVGEFSRIAPRV
jgi:superfamily II DNA or RNA helicase/diadenosine tetraphosphate (Ap4A) HIT family hydrolase/HKD family nuclease/SOS-response transcriptional repressor LexA